MNIPSPLLDRLAQLLILYEHLRIETFAVTESAEESMEVDAPDTRDRVQRSVRRFVVALLEFDRGLSQLSQTDEYKSAETNSENNPELRNLMATVSNASRYFRARHETLKSLGNSIEEHRSDKEAEIVFQPAGMTGGAKSDAGQSAAPTLARDRPAIEPSPEQIPSSEKLKDALCTVREGYAHATQATHALVAAFVRDRL